MRRNASLRVTLLVATAAIVVVASIARPDEAIVKTKDNNTYQGDVSESGPNYIVKSHGGVETAIPKVDVASVEHVSNYVDEYQARLSRLDPKDVAGRIALARDAFDQRQYDLARSTLEQALAIDPNSREATDLLGVVQTQIRLERAKLENPPPVAPATRPQVVAAPATDRRLLTAADIEAIRRAELQPSDTSVRIRFDSNDVKKRFADSQNVPFVEFSTLQPVEQAILILDRGDDTMRDKVHILTDPQSILEFRRQIQPLVLQNCATNACHGGPTAAGLYLLNNADNDAVTYTNFFILQNYRKRIDAGSGVFSGNMKRLIMRGHGEQSLLANYGLPTNIAEFDHPLVGGKPVQPTFRNKLDPRYVMVVEWMNNSLKNIDQDYGIHYVPPSPPPPAVPPTGPVEQ